MAFQPSHGRHPRRPKAPRVDSDGNLLPPKPQQVARPPYNGPPYSWRQMIPASQCLYLRTSDAADEAVDALMSPIRPIAVGFDIEWRPCFVRKQPENPVSLVQIASHDKILLFQVSAMKVFPSGLRSLLESADVAKVGVGIHHDCVKLYRDWSVSVRKCIELSLLARSADPRWTGKYNKPLGLAHLSEVYLERLLVKGRISRSNWEAQLSEAQKDYAANDAQAGYLIYTKLMNRITDMIPIPESDCYTFDVLEGLLRDANGRPWFPFNPNYDAGRVEPQQLGPRAAAALLEG